MKYLSICFTPLWKPWLNVLPLHAFESRPSGKVLKALCSGWQRESGRNLPSIKVTSTRGFISVCLSLAGTSHNPWSLVCFLFLPSALWISLLFSFSSITCCCISPAVRSSGLFGCGYDGSRHFPMSHFSWQSPDRASARPCSSLLYLLHHHAVAEGK